MGFALGYIVGGAVTAVASWRWAFVGEGLVMVPFTLFALTAQPLQLRGSKPAGEAQRRACCVRARVRGMQSITNHMGIHV